MDDFRLLSAGDTALVVEFGNQIDRQLNARVLALAHHLNEARIHGVIEVIPTFRSLMIQFDPLTLPMETLSARVAEFINLPKPAEIASQSWTLPVCYDADFALDLQEVADRLNLSPGEVINKHSSISYHVYMLGFLPGQAYMGDLPNELILPRRETPRQRIKAGSVAIAMSMTCIFPRETPCGWHLVGRCPVPLFESSLTLRSLLSPGDKVKFVPISRREYDAVVAELAAGTYKPQRDNLGTAA